MSKEILRPQKFVDIAPQGQGEDDDTQVYAADTAIVNTLLPKLYSIIDRLLDGQDKALVIEARRVLPKAYKNSFEKGKGV